MGRAGLSSLLRSERTGSPLQQLRCRRNPVPEKMMSSRALPSTGQTDFPRPFFTSPIHFLHCDSSAHHCHRWDGCPYLRPQGGSARICEDKNGPPLRTTRLTPGINGPASWGHPTTPSGLSINSHPPLLEEGEDSPPPRPCGPASSDTDYSRDHRAHPAERQRYPKRRLRGRLLAILRSNHALSLLNHACL